MANDSNTATMVSDKKVGKELVAAPPRVMAEGAIRPLIPTSMEELKYFANLIIGGGLAPDSYKNDPTKIALGIMKSLEVGLPPLTGINNIAIINNRPTIWGDAALALVQSRNVIERMEVEEIGAAPAEDGETSAFPADFGFKVSIWRRGQSAPYVGKFTVGDAKRARLWMNPSKAPWMQHPKRMLKIRATAFPLRDGFADCLAGLAIREEVEDMLPTQEAKTDTSFLDDAVEPKTIEHEPVSEAAPELLPVPQGDKGADWETWQTEAEKIIGQATSNTFLQQWVQVNKAPLANFQVYSPTAHAALVKMIDGVLAENARSAA